MVPVTEYTMSLSQIVCLMPPCLIDFTQEYFSTLITTAFFSSYVVYREVLKAISFVLMKINRSVAQNVDIYAIFATKEQKEYIIYTEGRANPEHQDAKIEIQSIGLPITVSF